MRDPFLPLRLGIVLLMLTLALTGTAASGAGTVFLLYALYAATIAAGLLVWLRRTHGSWNALLSRQPIRAPWMPAVDGTAATGVFFTVAGIAAVAPPPSARILDGVGLLGVLAGLVLMFFYIASGYQVLRGVPGIRPVGQRPFVVGAYVFAASCGDRGRHLARRRAGRPRVPRGGRRPRGLVRALTGPSGRGTIAAWTARLRR